MLNTLLLLVKKDLRSCLHAGGAFTQSVLTGLLLVLLINMAGADLPAQNPRLLASGFWLASLISIVLLAPALYRNERPGLTALLALGISPRLIWLEKTVSLMIMLAISQIVYLAAAYLFSEAPILNYQWAVITGIALCNAGLCVLGALLASLTGTTAASQLAGLIFTPVCLPLVLAGINLAAIAYIQEATAYARPEVWRTLLFIAATDMVFIAAALIFSPVTFRENSNE